MVTILGSLVSPTSRCRRRGGGACGPGIPLAAPLTREYPGPPRPWAPGPQDSSGQALSPILSTPVAVTPAAT